MAACACAGSLTYGGVASAQPLDANPPLPDVLLIVDTSGSMELMMDGCNVDTGLYLDGSGGGNCSGNIPCVAVGTNCSSAQVASAAPVGAPNGYCDGVTSRTPNRWATEVQALSGTLLASGGASYSCFSLPRTAGSEFATEYSYQYGTSVVTPYDINYYLNYHRPVEPIIPGSGSATTACAFGFQQGSTPAWNPSDTSGTGFVHSENPVSGSPDFAAAQIQGYTYYLPNSSPSSPAMKMGPVSPTTAGGVSTSTPTCTMSQATDGLLNYGLNSIRFGLMTIDSDTLPNTGVQSVSDSITLNLSFTDVANGGLANNLTTGMWSYYYNNSNGTWNGLGNWEQPGTTYPGGSIGRPAGCGEVGISNIPFEVGARNPAAPPWEGRMIRFPPSSVTSPAANNKTIMQAVNVMRPYGANPIAGLMDDAKAYFWVDPEGPSNSAVDTIGSCRPQYIILFSHAAPNDDLEPYCQGTANGNTGICPYDYPQYIAAGLAKGSYVQGSGVQGSQSASASGAPVKTFVVGFSLQTTLGDAGEFSSCKQILSSSNPPTILTDSAHCGTPTLNGDGGVAGNPIYASCCALAEIAVSGGTQVPYFADNQSDLNAALQAILGLISSSTTTRATPVLLPQSASSNSGGGDVAALFVSSFDPSTTAVWSGDVQRERYTCPQPSASSGTPPYTYPSDTAGDDFAYNLNNSGGQTRNVILVEPALNGSARNAAATIRPYIKGETGTPPIGFDGYSIYDGVEWGYSYTATGHNAGSSGVGITGGITTDALFPGNVCNYSQPGMTLNVSDCETIALGWLLGMQTPPSDWNTSIGTIYPSRYYTGANGTPSPFGAVYHSTPAVATPPSALLRDDSYQSFSQYYTSGYATFTGSGSEPRHTVLYVATTDGLLHAFGVDYSPGPTGQGDPYTFVGTGHANEGGTTGTQNEMWTFVPPAVLPQLMNSVGGGEAVVLDGAPVVKDTVFQRTTVGTGEDWHTTLVAGFGQAMGGYYALDVTDPSFADRGAVPNSFTPPAHTGGNSGTPATFTAGVGYMGPAGSPGAQTPPGGAMPMGPHFLWQLMDSNLFAPVGGTPAIGTVSIHDPDTTGNPLTEIGVAILPGGASTPTQSGTCLRVTCPAAGVTAGGSCTAGAAKISDASPAGYPLGPYVRQWNANACPGTLPSGSANPALTSGGGTINPAQGRSLTIVRLDTGEVLRTFTVLTDVPSNFALYGTTASFSQTASPKLTSQYAYRGRVTQADFDSPISGTPVPYPSDVGAITQRIFVGDQDGTIWRADVSDPNPNNWFVEPFIDAYNTKVQSSTAAAALANRAPIVLAPSLSIGRDGNVTLNFGTGDTNFIGTATNQNYAYAVEEVAPQLVGSSAVRLLASLDWWLPFPTAGEMITGPASVFDGGYYFATFRPSGGSACTAGEAYIWGMDFTDPASTTGVEQGASPTTVNNGGVYKLTGSSGLVQSIASGNAIIPGITITSSLACSTATATTDPATGGPMISMSSSTPPFYEISALQGKAGGLGQAAVSQVNVAVSVHSATLVDSWASIVE
ncbi:MAG: hypothetical protein ACLQVI_03370 [Polyangiaceae bacterium]